MAWKIAGNYIASCSCNVVCPCPVDGIPNDPNGKEECRGVAAFRVESGSMDDLDLSGTGFGLVNYWAGQPSKGNWKVGIVLDESASEDQAKALGQILSGDVGGPFADLAPLIGEVIGSTTGSISVSDSGGMLTKGAEFSFEPFRGADGNPTMVKNAVLGFVPEFQIGRTSGHADVHGIAFEGNYGEGGPFEYSSEGHEHIRG